MIRRSYLSVVRKKTKSIIMLLFLFIVSTLVLCSISIKNATNESMNLAKKSLGGEVTLSTDMSKLREEFIPQHDPSDESGELGINNKKEQMQNMHEKMSTSNATINDVKKIASIKYVSDVKYSFYVSAEEGSFSLYSNSTNLDDNNQIGPKMDRFNDSLQVEAINTFDLVDDYVDNKIELIYGESFDEEDENVAIISYELAVQNDLEVSDEIILKDSSSNGYTLKIIGIYQNKESQVFNNNYNKIYVNISTGEKFLTSEEYNDGNYNISSAVFYLNNPEKVEEFKTEANKLVTDLEERYLILDIDTNAYDKMISSIEGVSTFSNIILIVVIIASITIISLIVINSIKDRNYEIGVLLSLGEKKFKIIGQFVLEIILIAFISFILSIGTSMMISQKLANIILENQVVESDSFDNYQRGNKFGGKMDIMEIGMDVDIIDEIDVNVTIKDISILFVIEFGIIIISMVLPSIKILNSDPKDILSRKE